MTPEPIRRSTLAGQLLLAAALVVIACGCAPGTVVAAAAVADDPPFAELGPPSHVTSDEPAEADVEDGVTTSGRRTASADHDGAADDADEEADGPVAQSEEAQAAAYRENFDAARHYQAADMGKSRRYGRGHRSRDFPVGRVAVLVIVGVVVLRMVFAGRKTATAPVPARVPAPVETPTTTTATRSRQIVSLACRRCDRVLDLPRDRINRRLFCPRCGTVLPTDV